MIKLHNTKLESNQINSISLIDNNLYILYNNTNKKKYEIAKKFSERFMNEKFNLDENYNQLLELKLLKINLETMIMSDRKIIIKDINYNILIKKAKIIGNNIYVYNDNYTYVYNFSLELLNKYNGIVIDIFNINNIKCFLKVKGEYFIEDINNNIIIEIVHKKNLKYFRNIDNNIIKLDYNIRDCNVFHHNDYIIFHNEKIIKYNIKTRNIIELNNNYKKISNNEYIVKIKGEYNIYNLSEDKYQKLDNDLLSIFNEANIFFKLDKNHYVKYNETDFELTLYYVIDRFKNINNIGDKIKIGTQEKKVDISLNLLLKNSEYIKNIFNDFSNEHIQKELIHPSFEDIDIYHKFINNEFNVNNIDFDDLVNDIKNNTNNIEYYLNNNNINVSNLQNNIDNISNIVNNLQNNLNNTKKYINNVKNYSKNLMKLFKICNFLQDKNIDIVEKMIINDIIYNKTDKDVDLEYMELFYKSNNSHVLIRNTILSKHDGIILPKHYDIVPQKDDNIISPKNVHDMPKDEIIKNILDIVKNNPDIRKNFDKYLDKYLQKAN